MQLTEVILSSRCVNSTAIMLNKMIRARHCTRENRALVALKRVAVCQKPCETSLISQSRPCRQRKSRTAAVKTARLNMKKRTARKMETQRITMGNQRRVRRRQKIFPARSWRRSLSFVFSYDPSSTARTTSKKVSPSLYESNERRSY